jgi:MoaA/NifB/PqqE/SkfB family radical SAM enzyme
MRSGDRRRHLARLPGALWDLAVRGTYDSAFDLMPYRVTGMSAAARWNLARAALNVGWRRPHPWSMPIYMQIELTSACNLACPVCPTGSGELSRPAAMIDPDLVRSVLDEAGDKLLVLALWGWGEPLLHPRLREILALAARHRAATLVSTNGQRLDRDDVLTALADYPPAYVIVALDGLTDATNSVFRRGARLAPALAGVRRLAELRRERGAAAPILHMRFIAMKHNEHELPRVREFAAEHSFDFVSIRTLSLSGGNEEVHRSFVPSAPSYRPYHYEAEQRVRRDDYVCQIAFFMPTVLVDGTVVSCDQDFNAAHPYGKVGGGVSFRDVWFSEPAAAIRRRIRAHDARLDHCAHCPYADRETNACSIEATALRPLVLPS